MTALAAGLGVVAPAAASAAASACRPNVVCVYNNDQSWMGQYSEYTSYYQQLPRQDVVFERNLTPAAVYFSYSSGLTSCVISHALVDLRLSGYGNVTGLRLSSDNSCYPG